MLEILEGPTGLGNIKRCMLSGSSSLSVIKLHKSYDVNNVHQKSGTDLCSIDTLSN